MKSTIFLNLSLYSLNLPFSVFSVSSVANILFEEL